MLKSFQSTVDAADTFHTVWERYQEFLREHGAIQDPESVAYLTCGEWDLKIMLPLQLHLSGTRSDSTPPRARSLRHTTAGSTSRSLSRDCMGSRTRGEWRACCVTRTWNWRDAITLESMTVRTSCGSSRGCGRTAGSPRMTYPDARFHPHRRCRQ